MNHIVKKCMPYLAMLKNSSNKSNANNYRNLISFSCPHNRPICSKIFTYIQSVVVSTVRTTTSSSAISERERDRAACRALQALFLQGWKNLGVRKEFLVFLFLKVFEVFKVFLGFTV